MQPNLAERDRERQRTLREIVDLDFRGTPPRPFHPPAARLPARKALLSALLCSPLSLLPSQNRAAQQHAPSAVGWWDLSYFFYNNALEFTAASGPEKRGREFNCLSPVCSASSVCAMSLEPRGCKNGGAGVRDEMRLVSLQQAQQQFRTTNDLLCLRVWMVQVRSIKLSLCHFLQVPCVIEFRLRRGFVSCFVVSSADFCSTTCTQA